uniref:Uncharacterized protein n=1 Tax=uncultured Desulfobacterium sp. TaxID=201089 RepID=E1YCL1_9BACT|nr:unknown protein [uncultured Desulfobacterium sp.]
MDAIPDVMYHGMPKSRCRTNFFELNRPGLKSKYSLTMHIARDMFRQYYNFYSEEPLSKRFSLVKVKAGENFNHRNT